MQPTKSCPATPDFDCRLYPSIAVPRRAPRTLSVLSLSCGCCTPSPDSIVRRNRWPVKQSCSILMSSAVSSCRGRTLGDGVLRLQYAREPSQTALEDEA